MKRHSIALLFCLFLLCASTQAQQSEIKSHTYQLHFLTVSDTRPAQTLWMVDGGDPNVAYKSLDSPSLLQWVSQLPKGTEIEYRSPWAGFPILGNIKGNHFHFPDDGMGKQLDAFGVYCHTKGILFSDRFPIL